MGGVRISNDLLWEEYHEGKQTYKQLAAKYNCSIKTIQRRLDLVKLSMKTITPKPVIVLMDTTYFGRGFGVMLFKDAYTGQNLLKKYVKTETNYLYTKGLSELKDLGFTIKGIVCDGRKGLLDSIKDTPTQMCQFHQVAIIRRYLTKKPKMQTSKELWELTLMLKQTDKESFEGALSLWFKKWETFLNERKINEEGKNKYIHRRLRSAYRSLLNNLKYLFTWYDYYELGIPNTTNKIDGHFADLKNKLRCHNGLSIKRKMKFIDEFLEV